MTDSVPRSFLDLIRLDQLSATHFLGRTPHYSWGRVYGGQVVAQALRAAAATVNPEHHVHSLHAYFVLGGIPGEQILYEVDRLREGRSFTTRRVVAHQANGAILNLDASFQRVEDELDVQEPMLSPDVASPDSLESEEWSGFGEVRVLRDQSAKRFAVWMRVPEDLSGDPVAQACALAYLSDYGPMDAMLLSHPKFTQWEDLMTASLDHVVWFHRPLRDASWMLFDLQGHGLSNARGMATGSVFTQSGVHVATVSQEGLVRGPRVT